jgi:hypothetical protein
MASAEREIPSSAAAKLDVGSNATPAMAAALAMT